jgi:cytidylate kinase
VASALAARDQSDRTRAASPLALATDAITIDTTGIPIDEVVGRVLALIERR